MKRIVKIVFIVSVASAFTIILSCDNEKDTDEVYICTGPYSTKYHDNSNCRGLGNCSEDIDNISLSDAEDDGYVSCEICYKYMK